MNQHRESAVVRKARAVATALHYRQKRKFDGEAYISHPARVAKLVARAGGAQSVVAAAWLHDTIEDCNVTVDGLIQHYGIPLEVANLVMILTRSSEETHAEYVERVAHHPDAWLIKRADILDNLSTLPPGHGMHERYIKALAILHVNPPKFLTLEPTP